MYSKEEVTASTLAYFKREELPTSVWISKYCLKDNQGNLLELNPDDMHKRLAKEFARIEQNYPNSLTEDEIYNLLKDFKYIVPGGSQEAGIGNNITRTSLSNCFVIDSSMDSYGGIYRTDEEQVQLMKRRGGVGHDLSNLRPSGMLANNSILTGAAGQTLYMERFSNSTREVAQDGRRGALMLSTDVRHPDCDKFIDIKLTAGKVTGANISVKITDNFMESLESGKDFVQRFPVEIVNDWHDRLHSTFVSANGQMKHNELYLLDKGISAKKINPKILWDKIIFNAHRSAEPGVLFWDTILKESPAGCYGKEWKETSTNPCFVGDTKILTKDGFKSFESLIWTKKSLIQNEDRRIFYNHYNELISGRVWSNGFKHIIELTLSNGEIIKCTPDHKFMLNNGSTEIAKNLINCLLKSYDGILIYVQKIEDKCEIREVFDFNLDEGNSHWGIVEGVIAHNCGEIPLCPYDSCRLTAVNLYSYVIDPFTSQARFDFILFKKHINQAQRIMDDLIDLEIEKIDLILNKIKDDPEPEELKIVERNLWLKIKNKAVQGRRTGLGVTAEGDMLAALGLRYGSSEATEFSVEVHRIMAVESYKASIEMAEERGAFPIWDLHKEQNNPFIQRVLNEVGEIQTIEEVGKGIGYYSKYLRYGRRNIANLTIAPVGTGSLMTQTTSGIEPCFQPFYKRRTKTEDKSKIVYTDEMGDTWSEYFVIHPKFVEWFIRWNELGLNYQEGLNTLSIKSEQELNIIFENSPYCKATANDIDWKASVEMQGAIQKWIDHSISKTVNLPKEATIEIVDQVYRTAYKSGCKGVTIYRDGCRQGVLLTGKEEKKNVFEYTKAFERPKVVECDIYHKTALKEDWMVIVGKINGKPYEIFSISDVDNALFSTRIEKGTVTRVKSKTYELTANSGEKQYKLNNVIDLMSDDERISTRKYSSMLRHGMSPKYIIKQIKEFASITSFDKVIERVLKNYVDEEEKEVCPECGSENYHADMGCYSCPDCGFAKCG